MKRIHTLSPLLLGGLLIGCGDGRLPELNAPELAHSDISIAVQRDGAETLFDPTPYFYTVPGVQDFVWWKVTRSGEYFPFMLMITPDQRERLNSLLLDGTRFQVTVHSVNYYMSLTQPGIGNVMLFLKGVVVLE